MKTKQFISQSALWRKLQTKYRQRKGSVSLAQEWLKFVAAFLLIFTLSVGYAWGASPAVFGPSNFSGQGTSGTGSKISATVDGVTFECDKGYGTTQFRCYSGSTITISSSNTITAISFTWSGSYSGGLSASYSDLSTTEWTQTLSSQARLTACSVAFSSSGTTYTVI